MPSAVVGGGHQVWKDGRSVASGCWCSIQCGTSTCSLFNFYRVCLCRDEHMVKVTVLQVLSETIFFPGHVEQLLIFSVHGCFWIFKEIGVTPFSMVITSAGRGWITGDQPPCLQLCSQKQQSAFRRQKPGNWEAKSLLLLWLQQTILKRGIALPTLSALGFRMSSHDHSEAWVTEWPTYL